MIDTEKEVRKLSRRLGRLSITGTPDVLVAGNLEQGYSVDSRKRAVGACCTGPDCSILTESDCNGVGGTFQGQDSVCEPNPCGAAPLCDCVINATLETDCVQWVEPDPQPAWPDTWDCALVFAYDEFTGEDCDIVGHGRVRYRFQIVDALNECTLRWATEVVFRQTGDDDPIITSTLHTIIVPAGSSTTDIFEVPVPDPQGGCDGLPIESRAVVTYPFTPASELGACDLPDFQCFATDECTCEQIYGGTYRGTGTECGACCFDDFCLLSSGDPCAFLGGLYQGDGVPCDPNPCAV